MKRTTVVLPDKLHEELRQEAFSRRVSMAELIRARLERRPRSRARSGWRNDPLLKVSGIGNDGKLAEGIDEALYGI
jgi:Arc/MetJ-type ribon-helix-helix transcriptional regulator